VILALQYCKKDLDRSMELAHLLADLEPSYRTDVVMALVRDSATPHDPTVDDAFDHCRERFPTVQLVLPHATTGWPEGPNRLWAGVMDHFASLWSSRATDHRSIFTIDGGDGIPLHNNWLDLLQAEHATTTKAGKRVSGVPGIDNLQRDHLSGNMILDLSMWIDYPRIHECPPHDGWDCYHASIFISEASLSSVVRNDWRCCRSLSADLLEEYARTSVWWHGYKGSELRKIARRYLLDRLRGAPSVPSLMRWSSTQEFRATRPHEDDRSVSLVTGVHKHNVALYEALPSWITSSVPREIILVDWACPDPLTPYFKNHPDPRIAVVRVLDQDRWRGAKCRNLELRLATGKIVMRPNASFVPSLDFFNGCLLDDASFYVGGRAAPGTDDEIGGDGILYATREHVLNAGGYNEHLGARILEDADLYNRLSNRGIVKKIADPSLWHWTDASSEKNHDIASTVPSRPRMMQRSYARSDSISIRRDTRIPDNENGSKQPINKDSSDLTEWEIRQVNSRCFECRERKKGKNLDATSTEGFQRLEDLRLNSPKNQVKTP
jgi:hypothetical protein